jgi:tRNA A37 threonylcarbamoyltransferase TsaD
LCVDNAAMIGAAAFAAPALTSPDYLALDAYARSPLAG